ncbi:MAG TPA: flagellar motor protein MotB [Bacillales bacterium]|nr:flagellar motor protein MotB [Bacillales bacterium]
MSRRRRRKSSESESNDRWLITYSDMITLLLIFFIVLYAMSEVEKAKFNSLIESLRNAFEVKTVESAPTDQIGIDVPDIQLPASVKQPLPESKPKDDEQLDKLYAKLKHYIEENGLSAKMSLVDLPVGVKLTFQDSILFEPGEAQLKQEALQVLGDVSGLLKTVDNEISIIGHTDDVPVDRAEFRSNWELSTARAQSVRRYLQTKSNVKPARMRVVGYGEYKPKVPNDSKAHRAENRRVNIVVLREKEVEKSS